MSISAGSIAFKLAYELSPIILVNGIASNIPFQMLPIISITESINFATGLLSGSVDIDLDRYFAHFQPLPGATMIDQQIAMYPFLNQAVAANAVVSQPLQVSMLMHCPAQTSMGYLTKLATMTALQATLAQHNASGGTYTIITPSYFYTNCLMTGMRDVSSGETQQTQVSWQLDFVQPLLTLQQAQQAQSSMMNQLTNGTQIVGQPSYSGLAQASGQASVGSGAIIPAATGTPGSAVVGSQ